MFFRSICWFFCTFVAVVTATGYSGQDPNTEPSTADPLQNRNKAVDLGALLDAGEGAVVTLVSGDTRLAAHRAVLSARSAVFQSILPDADTGEVAILDVEGPVLRQLVAYLYSLQAPQLPAMAPQLLAAADQYGLPALKADCEQQVAKQLSVETAAATAVLAFRHSCDTLRKASIDYIRTHIFHVMATQGWADAINTKPQVMIKVMQLLSQSPAETSTPTSAASSATPTIEPQSVHTSRGRTAASAVSPTTSDSSLSSGSTNICLPCSSAPAENGSYPYHATQPQSDYSGHQTPATAAPTTVAQTVTSTDDVHISFLWSLSADEKNRRLMEAAKQGAVGEMEALLAAGANAGARGGRQRTPLHWAAAEGREEAARRLLVAGAAAGAGDSWQWTPLHYAAWRGHVAVVRLLLARGADHGARDLGGNTPLHLAAYSGHREAAAALLEAGADRAARDKWGDTPLDVARGREQQQLVELLEGSLPAGIRTAKRSTRPSHIY